MSFRVVFVVTRSTAPPNGELVGDVLYVSAPDGYRNIVYKVKHMMGLVRRGICCVMRSPRMIGRGATVAAVALVQDTCTSHAPAVGACERH